MDSFLSDISRQDPGTELNQYGKGENAVNVGFKDPSKMVDLLLCPKPSPFSGK